MQIPTDVGHGYLSTGCFHEEHEACRLTCKFCFTPCLCLCHWRNINGVLVHILKNELKE